MKRKWPAFARSSEVVGVLSGLLMVACLGRPDHEMTPLRVLGAMALVGSLAGFAGASLSSRTRLAPYHCVRLGARAGVAATLVASAALVLKAWSFPGSGLAWRGWILAAASLFPSMLAGTVAGGIGYFCFRRRDATTEEAVDEEPYALPRWFPLTVRGLVCLLWLVALAAPFFPLPYPTRTASAPAIADSVRVVREAPRPHFYQTPEGLKSVPAAAWRVSAVRHLGRLDAEQGFAMSKDQRLIVGEDGASDGSMVMFSLDSDAVTRTPSLPFSVARAAFNETADRLFLVSAESPPRLAVVELASHRVILLPQPKKNAVPTGPVYWLRERAVIFAWESQAALTLDLDTLELDAAHLPPEERERLSRETSPGFGSSERWKFAPGGMPLSTELPEVEGNGKWNLLQQQHLTLADSPAAYARLFPEIDAAPGDTWRSVADGTKMLRFRGGFLDVFHFDTRPIPPLRWKIKMPCGPDKMAGLDRVPRALKTGDLALYLYSPLINPLNSKTVGPDRTKPKAILTVASWEGTEAEVCVSEDAFPYQPGDVLADPFVTAPTTELIGFDQPHRWWTVCPEPPTDAADPAMLPSRDEISKRRDVELAKRRQEEEILRKKVEAQAAASARSNAVDVTPPVASDQRPRVTQAFANAIGTFIVQHHLKASEGRIREMVQDYAEQVDHFSNGVVSRAFILEDELKYHQKFNYIHEEVVGEVKVSDLGGGLIQAQYVMRNHLVKADGSQSDGEFEVTLSMAQQPDGGWRIVKHRTAKN